MTEHDDETTESDPGFLGGGSVAEETEPDDEESEGMHLADTDHGEL